MVETHFSRKGINNNDFGTFISDTDVWGMLELQEYWFSFPNFAVWNSSKQPYARNNQVSVGPTEEKGDRGRRPKKKTRKSLVKLKFFNGIF